MIRKNLYILTLLASVFSFAQVNLYSEVSTREAKVNSPLVFTVVLEIFGEDLVQETPVKLPDFSKFNYEFASEQNTFIDPVKKIRINQMVYQFSLDPKQTGNLKIGSALVKINGKMYKTEPIDINVKDADKKPLATNNISKNMYLNLQIEDKEVYKDEPVVAVLKAFSRNIAGFRHMETSKFGYSKSFAVRSIANFDESIEDSENNYSSQVIGMFVIVPKVVGLMDIPAAEVPLSGNKGNLISNKVKLNVKKLPEGAPANFREAVGKYDLKVELIDKSKENFEINKAFNVAVKVIGTGNLSPSILPKILPSADYETFEPKIINHAIPTNAGIEGFVEAQYVIIPKKRGDIKIVTEDFSYFNPKAEQYVNLGSKQLVLKAVSPQDIDNSKTTLQKVNEYTNNVLEKVDSPVINTQKLKIKEHKTFNWKGIFGNLLIVGLGSFLLIYANRRYRNNKKRQSQNKKRSSEPIINIAETEALLRNKKVFETDSYIHYIHKKLDEGNVVAFFKAFDELRVDADSYCQNQYSYSFSEYLKNNFDISYYDKYNQLISKINIEKYSPFFTEEKQIEIFREIEDIYRKL